MNRPQRPLTMPLVRRWLCAGGPLWLLVLLAACVPARTPPGLFFTPGPPVTVTDRVYEGSAFSARYPSGWRVVTGAADAPPSVTFVAPDDETWVTLAVEPPAEPESDPLARIETRALALEGGRVYALARVPVEQWADFQPAFERLLASVRPAG